MRQLERSTPESGTRLTKAIHAADCPRITVVCSRREAIPMQPLTATAAKPPDDIDAVLGRFQAWSASTRKATDKTSQKRTVLPDGVRELSYEEALESSRSRWQARTKPSVICDSTGEIPISADGKSVPAVSQGKSEPEAFPAAAFNAEAIQPDRLSPHQRRTASSHIGPAGEIRRTSIWHRARRSPPHRTRPQPRSWPVGACLAGLAEKRAPGVDVAARCRL